jgi:hypothetical protein
VHMSAQSLQAWGRRAWIFRTACLACIDRWPPCKPSDLLLLPHADDDCFVAKNPSGEDINVMQQHIRNLLTPSTPYFFNTLYDPYREGADFVRGYPFSLREGVPTAISHGLWLNIPGECSSSSQPLQRALFNGNQPLSRPPLPSFLRPITRWQTTTPPPRWSSLASATPATWMPCSPCPRARCSPCVA